MSPSLTPASVAALALLAVLAAAALSMGVRAEDAGGGNKGDGGMGSGTESGKTGGSPAGGAKPVVEPRKVLLTGFEPFGKRTINDSWEAVRALDGQTIGGRRVVTQRLPVVYDAIDAPLCAAIEREKPEIVISFGEGTEVIRVETVGRNEYHPMKPLDNAKKPPPRETIDPAGPATIPNALPTEKILKAWADAKIDARASDDAGGYLCNECLYRLLRVDGAPAAGIRRRGFIHVPVSGTKSPSSDRTFDLETLQRAARIAVEETVKDIDAEDAAAAAAAAAAKKNGK